MQKHSVNIALGLLVAFVPFLGIPSSWKAVLFVVFGLSIAGTSLLLRRDEHAASGMQQNRPDTYMENAAPDNTAGNDSDEAIHQQ